MRLPVQEKREKHPTRVVDWLNARLTLIFGLILAVFLLSFTVSWYAFSIQRQLDDQKVLLREDADGMLRTMIDQQSGLQSYISSNNQLFLTAFQQGHPIYLTYVRDLTTQLQSGPFRHTAASLTAVEEVADEWYSSFALVQVDEMQAGKFAAPRSEASILQGNFLFDQFRAAVTQLQQAVGQDLAGYQNQVDTINLSLVIGIIALLLGANAAFLWILRNFTGKLQTQLVGLTRTTQRLGQGEQTARVDALTFTDLDQVGQSINGMADAIQQHQNAAEEAMHTLEHQYTLVERAQSESRAIFDASSEAYLFISASGQVNALNRPFCEFFALASADVVGMSFADLQRQWEPLFADATSFHADLEQDHTNQERSYTTTAIQKEPQYRELTISSTPVVGARFSVPVPAGDGQARLIEPAHADALLRVPAYLGRLYVLRDITHEREAERLKAEFYALVSHGLRTPLTSIKGYTDLLIQQEEAGPLTELQLEFLDIVQSDARRLVGLVNDLLDLSRLEAQTLEIRKLPLDIHSLIRGVTQSMRPQIEGRGQRLTLHLADSPLIVLGDENRMSQILTNLLTFTTSHTPVGGRIDWETETLGTRARITCFSSGNLTAEDQAAFNRPFFHDSALSSPETVGTMLGPSIARSLVELHGGVLQMHSEAGVGITLMCTFPLSLSQAPIQEEGSTTTHIVP